MSNQQNGCGGNCSNCGCDSHANEIPAVFDSTTDIEFSANEMDRPLATLFDDALENLESSTEEKMVEEEVALMNVFFMLGAISTIRLMRDGAYLVSDNENTNGTPIGYSMNEIEQEAMAEIGTELEADEDPESAIAPAVKHAISNIMGKPLSGV